MGEAFGDADAMAAAARAEGGCGGASGKRRRRRRGERATEAEAEERGGERETRGRMGWRRLVFGEFVVGVILCKRPYTFIILHIGPYP